MEYTEFQSIIVCLKALLLKVTYTSNCEINMQLLP